MKLIKVVKANKTTGDTLRSYRDQSRMSRSVMCAACVLLIAATGGCSFKSVVVNSVGNAIANSGTTYSADPDIELVGDASPFGLKLMESLLAESPRHQPLLLAAARGFTQYAFAYVHVPADELEQHDVNAAYAQRARARRLYVRARDYGLRGLEVSHPGITSALRTDPRKAVEETGNEDVALLYWTAAAWGAAIGLGKDEPALLADIPVVELMARRVLALDESFEAGAVHGMLMSLVMAKPGTEAARQEAIETHFRRAVALSHGLTAAPYVAYAESVAIPRNDKPAFESMLQRALHIDKAAAPQWRLANEVFQRRARWLLAHQELYFVQ